VLSDRPAFNTATNLLPNVAPSQVIPQPQVAPAAATPIVAAVPQVVASVPAPAIGTPMLDACYTFIVGKGYLPETATADMKQSLLRGLTQMAEVTESNAAQALTKLQAQFN
jgi:hypothetical protein